MLEESITQAVAAANTIAQAFSSQANESACGCGERLPNGVECLGRGEWATGYGYGDLVIKMFRQRSDYRVGAVIADEVKLHKQLGSDPGNPFPALHAFHILGDCPEQENQAVGYIIFERVRGKPLNFEDLLNFESDLLGEWMLELARAEMQAEQSLARIEPLEAWGKTGEETFVSDWVSRINERTDNLRAISKTYVEDRKLAADVAASFRTHVTRKPILLNGSIQPDNTLTRFGQDQHGRKTVEEVRLIDPFICRAVWTLAPRWLSLYPDFAERYAEAYAGISGLEIDRVSLAAYSVLTHLHNALKYEDPKGSVYRPQQANLCRIALAMWVEKWTQAIDLSA